MAIIRKFLARDNFTQADNKVVQNHNLSDGAKVLYWYMASHKNAFQLHDGLIRLALGWSQSKVTRYKNELKDEHLILIDKIDRTTYFLYIGSSQKSALQVKKEWDSNEGPKNIKE